MKGTQQGFADPFHWRKSAGMISTIRGCAPRKSPLDLIEEARTRRDRSTPNGGWYRRGSPPPSTRFRRLLPCPVRSDHPLPDPVVVVVSAEDTTLKGAASMTVTLNKKAVTHAKHLVEDGRAVHDERDDWSEHAPSTDDENRFIDENGFADYGKWYLGVDGEMPDDTKGHYSFPYGDFTKVHRCAVISGGEPGSPIRPHRHRGRPQEPARQEVSAGREIPGNPAKRWRLRQEPASPRGPGGPGPAFGVGPGIKAGPGTKTRAPARDPRQPPTAPASAGGVAPTTATRRRGCEPAALPTGSHRAAAPAASPEGRSGRRRAAGIG